MACPREEASRLVPLGRDPYKVNRPPPGSFTSMKRKFGCQPQFVQGHQACSARGSYLNMCNGATNFRGPLADAASGRVQPQEPARTNLSQSGRDGTATGYFSTRRMSKPPTFDGSIAACPSVSPPRSRLSRRNAFARANDATPTTIV